MISYYKPVYLPDGSVLSCDKITLNCYLDPLLKRDFELFFSRLDLLHLTASPESTKSFNFRYFFTFNYPDSSSMTVRYCLNGAHPVEDSNKVFIEFNPNKVCNSGLFWSDFREIISCMKSVKIARTDIALDVPVPREHCFTYKSDQRLYDPGTGRSFADRTETLGSRNHIGFVRVYNKKSEAELDYDLTRIEVTCDSVDSYLRLFPEVYCLDNLQIGFDISKLDSTDLYILQSELILIANNLDPGFRLFNTIGHTKKQKLKAVLCPESATLSVPGLSYVSSVFNVIKDDFLK